MMNDSVSKLLASLLIGVMTMTLGCKSTPRVASLPGFGWLASEEDPVLERKDPTSSYPPPSASAVPATIQPEVQLPGSNELGAIGAQGYATPGSTPAMPSQSIQPPIGYTASGAMPSSAVSPSTYGGSATREAAPQRPSISQTGAYPTTNATAAATTPGHIQQQLPSYPKSAVPSGAPYGGPPAYGASPATNATGSYPSSAPANNTPPAGLATSPAAGNIYDNSPGATSPPAAPASNIYGAASTDTPSYGAGGNTWSTNGPPADVSQPPAILDTAQQLANNATRAAQEATNAAIGTASAATNQVANTAQEIYRQGATALNNATQNLYDSGASTVAQATTDIYNNTQNSIASSVQQASAAVDNLNSQVQGAVHQASIGLQNTLPTTPQTVGSVSTAWRPGSTTDMTR